MQISKSLSLKNSLKSQIKSDTVYYSRYQKAFRYKWNKEARRLKVPSEYSTKRTKSMNIILVSYASQMS